MKREEIEVGEIYQCSTKANIASGYSKGQNDGMKFTAIVIDTYSTYDHTSYARDEDGVLIRDEKGRATYNQRRGIRVMPVMVNDTRGKWSKDRQPYPSARFPETRNSVEIKGGGEIVIPTKCVLTHEFDVMMEEALKMDKRRDYDIRREEEERERQALKDRIFDLDEDIAAQVYGRRKDSLYQNSVRLDDEFLDMMEAAILRKHGIEA